MSKPIDATKRAAILQRGMATLETLTYCREMTNRPMLGMEAERVLVGEMLNDLALATALDEIDQELSKVRKTA